MLLNHTLAHVIDDRLEVFDAPTLPAWRLWRRKTFNMDRGVLYWDAADRSPTVADIGEQAREVVRDRFRPGRLKGFAFGVVVVIGGVDDSCREAGRLIDVVSNSKGCWQWLVISSPAQRRAMGFHSWVVPGQSYLSPVYEELMDELRRGGYACETVAQDMPNWLRTMQSLANPVAGLLSLAIHGWRKLRMDPQQHEAVHPPSPPPGRSFDS